MSFTGHPVYLIHSFFVWKKRITEKCKTCRKDQQAKNDKEDIPKAISDSESHFSYCEYIKWEIRKFQFFCNSLISQTWFPGRLIISYSYAATSLCSFQFIICAT